MVLEEDSRQEWVFTLYDFDKRGKVTKEVGWFLVNCLNNSNFVSLYSVPLCILQDMFSLIHSMYEVIEASVKQPGHTPLKIKLAVTPTACPDKISQKGKLHFYCSSINHKYYLWHQHTEMKESVSHNWYLFQNSGTTARSNFCDDNDVPISLKTATEKEQSTHQKAGNPERKLYCVDENIERRNHYLDLAGIENYTSKFDNTGIESPLLLLLITKHFILNTHLKAKQCLIFFFQNHPLRNLHSMLTLLFSTTQWQKEVTASPMSLLEVSLSFIP